MADRNALEAAVAAGILRADQVGPLFEFLRSGASSAAGTPGEEELRFIRNFHDVFLAIGIVLLAIGLGVAIGSSAAAFPPAQAAAISGGLCLGAAVAMWGLGEVFARRRRLFLPAIAIVCAMTVFVVVGAVMLYGGVVAGQEVRWNGGEGVPASLRAGFLIAAAFAFLTPAAFYLRFRLPFSIGMAGAGVAFFVIVSALLFAFDAVIKLMPALYLGLGLLLFAAGVAFDARDPARVSRYSDNGFWLHFAAAPLILGGAFGLIGQGFGQFGGAELGGAGNLLAAAEGGAGDPVLQAAVTLVVVFVLGFVSLLINRRVLIVSALLTTGVAIGVILNEFGMGAGSLAAAVLIVLGGFVLILGAGWRSVRRALLAWLTPQGVWARILPPETALE